MLRLLLLCSTTSLSALRLSQAPSRPSSLSAAVSRRELAQHTLAAGALAFLRPGTASADEESFNAMGGALAPYVDGAKGYKLYKPTAWNQFDADPGVYDVKFQDLIEPFEIVQVSSSPVASATSISALGEPADLGAKLAASRSAKLLSSSKREADGFLVYTVELEGEQYHEYQTLSINKGKLYRLSTVTSNKRWPKRKELYKNIALSFVPKGF